MVFDKDILEILYRIFDVEEEDYLYWYARQGGRI